VFAVFLRVLLVSIIANAFQEIGGKKGFTFRKTIYVIEDPWKLFQDKPGETEVRFRLELPRDFSVILDVPVKVRPDREFRAALEKICGADAMEVLAN